ncbi:MAG: HAMP domain-containing histidine kinase [Bacteroidaceae bacterium]|nr:HAMP domain-containing histidine kinase [Bacteroidaceae bacterium]
METNQYRYSDRDLFVALSEDYLNVYRIRVTEDSIDVIKLDGFITEGIGDTWTDLRYSTILDNYTRTRVHQQDRERFRTELKAESLLYIMTNNKVHHGRYRVLERGETHYYGYKIIRVSTPEEPLRVVAAFRNVDNIVMADMLKMQELEDMRNIMAASQMGTWHIFLNNDRPPRMTTDRKMRELLGIPFDARLTDEETYNSWYSRIDPTALQSVKESVQQMIDGQRSENTYKWIHPVLGERYVRCGGTAAPVPGGHVLSGYHYDVTDQVKKEHRSTLIINSLASSYDFLCYIRFNGDNQFSSFTEGIYGDGKFSDQHRFIDVKEAIRISCEEHVADAHKEEMMQFADLSTVDSRMEHRNVLINQFKDENLVWYEWSYIVADRNSDGSIKHLIWAVRKIDDEKQAELRRQRMLEDTIAANKAKTMFLQNMSHDIRTPLNAMYGFAQLLGLPDGSWTEDEKCQFNGYISNSFNVLEMLIGDIIDIADSEHGHYRIEIAPVTVNDVCRNAIKSVEFRVSDGINLYYTSELPDDYQIQSDGIRIQQVLINYLTNASKYTQKGEIHLHCSDTEHPGWLSFSVADTGKGVPADKAEIIFNRFTKLNEYVQGSGLGLNICQMIAEKLNGRVYLDKSYTRGARFIFEIPNENGDRSSNVR